MTNLNTSTCNRKSINRHLTDFANRYSLVSLPMFRQSRLGDNKKLTKVLWLIPAKQREKKRKKYKHSSLKRKKLRLSSSFKAPRKTSILIKRSTLHAILQSSSSELGASKISLDFLYLENTLSVNRLFLLLRKRQPWLLMISLINRIWDRKLSSASTWNRAPSPSFLFKSELWARKRKRGYTHPRTANQSRKISTS